MSIVNEIDPKEVRKLRDETGMGLAEAVRIKKIEAIEEAIFRNRKYSNQKDIFDILKAMMELIKHG